MVAGIDEVGRGCLAGPVFAAVVVLDSERPILGLADSKKLTDSQRRTMADQLKKTALAWAVGRAEASEVDRINVLQASLLAMQRAVMQLPIKPDKFLVDGNFAPDLPGEVVTVVRGDQTVAAISAASVIAKVARDDEMIFLDKLFPQFGFARHKAYPTRLHLAALREYGTTVFHRLSFAPVKRLLNRDVMN